MVVSQRAIDLILEYEGFVPHPYWPHAKSGITIGYGYDLGYVSDSEFMDDWDDTLHMNEATFVSLIKVVGLRGNDARLALPSVEQIPICKHCSMVVFTNRSLPKYAAMTEQAFPGVDKLPSDAAGALVSLVYNRGGAMNGDDRREMRAIREAVPKGDLREIARLIRAMKRLWPHGLGGLLKRREAEAALVESRIA